MSLISPSLVNLRIKTSIWVSPDRLSCYYTFIQWLVKVHNISSMRRRMSVPSVNTSSFSWKKCCVPSPVTEWTFYPIATFLLDNKKCVQCNIFIDKKMKCPMLRNWSVGHRYVSVSKAIFKVYFHDTIIIYKVDLLLQYLQLFFKTD